MKINFRITSNLLKRIHDDLSRPHPFAAERVGFISCGVGSLSNNNLLILGENYYPVLSEHYIDDPNYGAMMGAPAIREALQLAYKQKISIFHVHRHEHIGKPGFSHIDLIESNKFIPDFWKVRPNRPHGTIVLSHNSMAGLCWHPKEEIPIPIDSFSAIKQTYKPKG